MSVVMWFRRDLRLADNPALALAAASGPVVPVFVLDPVLVSTSGLPRLHVLHRTLSALNEQCDGKLVIRSGSPDQVLARVVAETGATAVHCARDFGPYGTARDCRVAESLGVPLHQTGSPYAVDPGQVGGPSGYQVYSAFYRAWLAHGTNAPGPAVAAHWVSAESEALPLLADLQSGVQLPAVGEVAAHQAWREFHDAGLRRYADTRDRPDLDATSRMSVHLKWGTIHPRTLLADLTPADETYRKELAWREFYADVLFHRPETAREYYRPELRGLKLRDPSPDDPLFLAWANGRTGFPIVDAGMRQLSREGWMHNRVRMIVASFLVKDLHIEWIHGARFFLRHLIDGDLASNNHGWQWVAGTGTDAAPFFRVFNPILQGKKFDPDGDYVRRFVPELAHLSAKYIHEPNRVPAGAPADYPAPIVDHFAERQVALSSYQALR